MKADEIEVGMLVCDLDHTLRGMTVADLFPHPNGTTAVCVWREGGTEKRSTFPISTLLLWSPRFWHARR